MAMNDPHILESWEEYFTEWEATLWPVFERRHFTKDAAFMIWMLNRVANALEGDEEEEEPWRTPTS